MTHTSFAMLCLFMACGHAMLCFSCYAFTIDFARGQLLAATAGAVGLFMEQLAIHAVINNWKIFDYDIADPIGHVAQFAMEKCEKHTGIRYFASYHPTRRYRDGTRMHILMTFVGCYGILWKAYGTCLSGPRLVRVRTAMVAIGSYMVRYSTDYTDTTPSLVVLWNY